ncbi:SDR family NAD(P)-dependent oxidoreductase [Celeribacter halophilus]|uniref:SDR family NAD(P)-dependent oxidoreductase n=1 Tax=Celeribacter halophilus TaxID=576117 RepID=UPI003A917EB3
MRMNGKVAIITGGAGGIGLATAQRFVSEGAKVMLVDIGQDALDKAQAGFEKDQVATCVADVSDPDDTQRYIAETIKRFGRLDTFFANAGTEGVIAPITEYPLAAFDKVMAVNIRGVWLGLHYGIPEISKFGGGSFIITSSIGGLKGAPGLGAYVTSKHALVGMMRTAALEAAPMKVRVNTIHPSPIETRMMRSIEAGAAPDKASAAKDAAEKSIPLGRYGTPDEVADLAVFLASEESKFCTGGRYSIDGGMSAT